MKVHVTSVFLSVSAALVKSDLAVGTDSAAPCFESHAKTQRRKAKNGFHGSILNGSWLGAVRQNNLP